MNTNAKAGGSNPDLLSSILGVTVRNEEKITEQDRVYCQLQQDKLYQTLDQLAGWYKIFIDQALDPRYEHLQPKFHESGAVKFKEPYGNYPNSEGDYQKFEFYPFKCINRIIELAATSCSTFSRTVIEYFKTTYNLEIPEAGIGRDGYIWGYKPAYMFLVDHVIGHLGGKSFRETAEEELITRFLDTIKPWGWDIAKPEVKGDKIVFPRGVSYGSSYDRQNFINWENIQKFDRFCAGIYFGCMFILNGHSEHITDFDRENVDFNKWYNVTASGAATMKLYKNGRVDVKFKEKRFAEQCFERLRLNTFQLPSRK